MSKLTIFPTLFEVTDIFGKKIRTTVHYWNKITQEKHTELCYDIHAVKQVLIRPDTVHRSVTDSTIALYRKRMKQQDVLTIAVKHLNGEGFIVTAYQTKKTKIKGEKLWPTT